MSMEHWWNDPLPSEADDRENVHVDYHRTKLVNCKPVYISYTLELLYYCHVEISHNFYLSMSMAALSHRKPTYTRISGYTFRSQGHHKRDTLYNNAYISILSQLLSQQLGFFQLCSNTITVQPGLLTPPHNRNSP
jgi:hypothetical protein